MYYGIDLGTTNSLIGSGEELYTGLVSSSVNSLTGKQVSRDVVGENIVSSYKVDMTTGSDGDYAVRCSSVILRDLANRVHESTGNIVEDVVISVPAKFHHSQRQAVCKAGAMAGLNVVGLINEPTAAAIYMCRDIKDLVVGEKYNILIDERKPTRFVINKKVKNGEIVILLTGIFLTVAGIISIFNMYN